MLEPTKINRDNLEGKGLELLDPWPDHMQLVRLKSHRYLTCFAGEKLSIAVYEAEDGVLKLTDFPYDEQCTVLSGRAILTSEGGEPQEFKQGDTFVVPKGWNGTWEMKDGYRELITFETQSYEYAMKTWFDEEVR